ncbi:MAG: hypothetical protein K0R28_5264 [Paenibacillus sp.]|jgi:hypothetical protein|uniref:DUF2627 domain-containing protein n=1 Tax=Paenibacillus hemerocallicola TaxID=1172614 RepID=A0A5C4TEG2_9BACL|nr:DUF2627 domain-containing protein [Paenibacillus hemerocallicola]MDF2718339.1 hypothetical protein [Paenibacillus sp.]TNJ67355.1 DUF2627 domain-containing protein [Paenibacillus hemerocallicola]
MKDKFQRFVAILLLIIPGAAATYGFLAMKDALFAQFGPEDENPHILWGKMLLGFVLFAAGVAFIGGWIFFRDRKRNYVAPRFRAKKKRS